MNTHQYSQDDHAEQPEQYSRPGVVQLWKLAKEQGMRSIVVTTFSRMSRDPVRAAAIRSKLPPLCAERITGKEN